MGVGRWLPEAVWGPTVLRVMVGFIFVMYGWDNGVSFPLALFATTVALALMGSGAAALDEVLARRQAIPS
jgi:uncharacterized membrane protein YphA (DoxX/SURF4 family)